MAGPHCRRGLMSSERRVTLRARHAPPRVRRTTPPLFCGPLRLSIYFEFESSLHLFIHLIRFPEALRSRTWQRRNVAFSRNIALPPLQLSLLHPDHCPARLLRREIRTTLFPPGASAAQLNVGRARGSPGLLLFLPQPHQGAAALPLGERSSLPSLSRGG